jgi:hypothetical protein
MEPAGMNERDRIGSGSREKGITPGGKEKKSDMNDTTGIHEEKIELARSCIEHRATWMALIYDEMEKRGCNAEAITRAAVKRCGNIHGTGFKEKCKDPDSVTDFSEVFLPENSRKIFGMDVVDADRDNLKLEFHYCALVNAWKKLGLDDQKISLLCDIAMDGDRGIAESMGLKLDLTDTIAKGCAVCKLRFHK